MKLFVRNFAFLAVIACFSAVRGQNTIWSNNGGTTSFETTTNWNNGLPSAGLNAYVVPDGVADSTGQFLVTPGGLTNIVIVASASHSSDGLFITNDTEDNLTPGTVTMTFASGTTYTINGFVGVRDAEALTYSGNLTAADGVSVGYGGNGSMTFNSGTLDTSGGILKIGDGTGNSGTFTQSGSSGSTVLAGEIELGTSGGSGTYVLGGSGTKNLTLSAGGTVDIGTGTFTQNDSTSTVDFSAAGSATFMGLTSGDTAVYQLESGTLKLGDTFLGSVTGSTATVNQSGGTLISTGTFDVGGDGVGNYLLSGGSADFQDGFTVSDPIGSTVTQSGSSILTSEGAVAIGTLGTGTYNLEGGTATFNGGIVLGATGTIDQTGGTLIIPTGQTLDLSAVGATYNLGGGKLEISNGDLVGTTGQGTLNFAGGTLQNSGGGTLTDALDGTVTGTNTLDTTNGNITLSGLLTDGVAGHGILNVIGSGVVDLTGANSGATWGVNIVNGTVNADAALFPASGDLAIGSAGILNLAVTAGGVQELNGNLSGAGIFNVNFGGAGDTLELAGATSNSGTTNLSGGGTLQIFNGTWGNINGAGAKLTIGGDAAVAVAGTVDLTGINTYTGLTTINSGFTVKAANTVAGGVVTHDAFNGNVTNAGTLSPTTPLSTTLNAPTLSINGTFNSSGTLVVRMNGIAADQYKVTGPATLSGNILLVNGSGTGSYTIIDAASQTGGDTLTINAPSTLFSASLTTTGSTVVLNTVQQPLSGFALTPNQQAVATVLDPLTQTPPAAFAPVLAALNNLPASSIPGALESLTPESLQYARMISFENSTMLVQRMNGVDADLRGGYGGLDTSAINIVAPGFDSSLGRSLGSLLAYNDPSFHQAAPNGVNYYPGGGGDSISSSSSPSSSSPSSSSTPPWNSSSQVISDTPNPYLATRNPAGPETPGFSEFISGDAILADLNQDQSAANAPSSKAHYTAGDATAGVSFRMTSHLSAGVLMDYNHTDAKTDSSGSKTTVDSYSPGLFATYFDHGFYINGLFSFGYNNYSNSRNIAFLGKTASSSPSGQQYVGDLDVGYDFHPDKNWVVGPTLGVTYTHLNIDSFTETGAPGADLAVGSQSADSLRSRLGGHVVFQTNTGDVLLQPNITAVWQHEYLNNGSGITSTFSDFSSSSFTTETAAPSRDSALIGVGLTATLSNSMALYLNYFADIGADDYWAQSVVGGFKARF